MSTDRETVDQQIRKLAEEEARGCACGNIRQAARAVTQLFDEALRPSGLRATQFGILAATMAMGPLTVTKLADVTVTDRTTLTRNLKLLAKKGLIRIQRGNDGREREVTLTERGRDALAKGYPFWQKAQAHVVKGLGEERWSALREGLAAVVSVTRGS